MAIVIQMKLVEENPAVTDFRSRLSDCRTSLAGLLWTPWELSDAEAELRASLSINEDLAKASPTVPGYRDNLASGHRASPTWRGNEETSPKPATATTAPSHCASGSSKRPRSCR